MECDQEPVVAALPPATATLTGPAFLFNGADEPPSPKIGRAATGFRARLTQEATGLTDKERRIALEFGQGDAAALMFISPARRVKILRLAAHIAIAVAEALEWEPPGRQGGEDA